MKNFFEIINGTFSSHDQHFIKNINLQISNKGDIICLLGPSGVGKTTILRTIAGLEKLNDGEIWLDGELLSSKKYSVDPEKRNIALSFQDNCLFPHKNVLENIMLGMQRKTKKKKERTLDDFLKLFKITNLKNKFPHEISIGESQRVSLVRALVSSPELILLDEPFSSIDQILKEDLQRIVRDIVKETHTSAIIVTHDPNEAFYLGDKCGIIIDNDLKQYDTPYNIYHFPKSLEVVNFLKKGSLINVKILTKNSLEHKFLGIINGKFGCSNLNPFSIGDNVNLLIQPEDIEHDDKSNLKLKIIDRKFRGTNFIYTLKTPNNELIPVLVESHHQHLHENNENFGIKTPIDIDHLVCFKKK
jgi:iron(III) transport system ATP-binding protein